MKNYLIISLLLLSVGVSQKILKTVSPSFWRPGQCRIYNSCHRCHVRAAARKGTDSPDSVGRMLHYILSCLSYSADGSAVRPMPENRNPRFAIL